MRKCGNLRMELISVEKERVSQTHYSHRDEICFPKISTNEIPQINTNRGHKFFKLAQILMQMKFGPQL